MARFVTAEMRSEAFAEPEHAQESAAAGVALVLGISPRTADLRVMQAVEMVDRLPGTVAALCAGTITLSRARVIHAETINLPAKHLPTVESRVLPDAPRLTPANPVASATTSGSWSPPTCCWAPATRAAGWPTDHRSPTRSPAPSPPTPAAAASLDPDRRTGPRCRCRPLPPVGEVDRTHPHQGSTLPLARLPPTRSPRCEIDHTVAFGNGGKPSGSIPRRCANTTTGSSTYRVGPAPRTRARLIPFRQPPTARSTAPAHRPHRPKNHPSKPSGPPTPTDHRRSERPGCPPTRWCPAACW